MLLADHLDRPTMGERLVNGEIEASFGGLQARAVERAAPVHRLRPTARGTHEGRPIGALLHEQELDAAVGRSFQGLLPAGRGPAVPGGLLAPAPQPLLLPALPPPA